MATAYQPPTAFSVLPPVIKNLLIINGLAFLGQMVLPPVLGFDPLREWFALWPAGTPEVAATGRGPAAVPQFWPWQLVTSAFLHGGLGHIFFNLFALFIFGLRVEGAMGSRRFAGFYLACVLGASAVQLAVTSAPFVLGVGDPLIVPTLGASGGVLGVLAAFGLMYPDEPIYLYFLFPIPAKWLVLGFAALDLFSGVTGSQAGVANFAHLGGMATGALLVLYWRGQLPVGRRTLY